MLFIGRGIFCSQLIYEGDFAYFSVLVPNNRLAICTYVQTSILLLLLPLFMRTHTSVDLVGKKFKKKSWVLTGDWKQLFLSLRAETKRDHSEWQFLSHGRFDLLLNVQLNGTSFYFAFRKKNRSCDNVHANFWALFCFYWTCTVMCVVGGLELTGIHSIFWSLDEQLCHGGGESRANDSLRKEGLKNISDDLYSGTVLCNSLQTDVVQKIKPNFSDISLVLATVRTYLRIEAIFRPHTYFFDIIECEIDLRAFSRFSVYRKKDFSKLIFSLSFFISLHRASCVFNLFSK